MNIEELRSYALSKPAVTESLPFDENTLVFKVLDKMFLLVGLESEPLRFNFKALPDDGMRYRELYPAVKPGYHSNKIHWNTVSIDGSIARSELQKWIDQSYDLVVAKLPRYKRESLKKQE